MKGGLIDADSRECLVELLLLRTEVARGHPEAFKQRSNALQEALPHAFGSWIRGVEVDTALGTADVNPESAHLQRHLPGEFGHLAERAARSHTQAARGDARHQLIDHDEPTSGGLGVAPRDLQKRFMLKNLQWRLDSNLRHLALTLSSH